MAQKNIRWLLRELPSLVGDGVLDGGAAERLRSHYADLAASRRNWALTIFGILGGGLVGLGVILLLAHNWSGMPRPVRTLLSIAPLLCAQCLAGWGLLRGKQSTSWRETVAILWTLSIGASTALVAQTYHISGSASQFALTWMLFTIPVVYLLNATSPALIYLAGIIWWAMEAAHGSHSEWWLWPLLALVVPHTMQAVRGNPYRTRPVLLLWGYAIALCFAVPLLFENNLDNLWVPVFCGLFGCYYLVGTFWFDDSPSVWQKPFVLIGSLASTLFAFVFASEAPWREVRWYVSYSNHQFGYFSLYDALAALPVIAVIMLLVSCVRRGKTGAMLLGAMPILATLGYVLSARPQWTLVTVIVFNIYVFALGAQRLVIGFKSMRVGMVNTGILLIFALIILRFFDTEMSFVARGIVFVILGVAFLVTNVVLARRKTDESS
ncbi:MAG: DUF2157 domain-containing protein [Kiritimatiellae bacterium]|nr:DUF2157 domain-containing protein [Kiritimatiellia bacterium]